MAKARIRTTGGRTTRIVGPTLFTERVRPATSYDVERVYYEAWRLRSDGWIQSRIVRTWPVAGEDSISKPTEHNSAFTNWRRFKDHEVGNEHHARLRALLEKMKADVVKESYR